VPYQCFSNPTQHLLALNDVSNVENRFVKCHNYKQRVFEWKAEKVLQFSRLGLKIRDMY